MGLPGFFVCAILGLIEMTLAVGLGLGVVDLAVILTDEVAVAVVVWGNGSNGPSAANTTITEKDKVNVLPPTLHTWTSL